MLDRTRNAAGDVQVALELLAGHTDIAVKRHIFERFRHRTGGTDRRARGARQILDQLHVFLAADALTGRNHALGLCDRGIDRDADRKVVSVLLQRCDQSRNLFLRRALLEDLALAHAGNRRGLFRLAGRTACALRRLAQDVGGNDHALDLVRALIDRGDLGVAVHALHIHALEEARAAEDL